MLGVLIVVLVCGFISGKVWAGFGVLVGPIFSGPKNEKIPLRFSYLVEIP
jgi:hypothetical protein